MSDRQTVHQLVEELDDARIRELLIYLDGLMQEQRDRAATRLGDTDDGGTESAAGPTGDGEDRLRALIGIGHSVESTDVARFKDEYLAEAHDAKGR
jgi:hypothetical protein